VLIVQPAARRLVLLLLHRQGAPAPQVVDRARARRADARRPPAMMRKVEAGATGQEAEA
jgi:hypothetical protein